MVRAIWTKGVSYRGGRVVRNTTRKIYKRGIFLIYTLIINIIN